MERKSEKTFTELENWIHTFSDYRNREEYQLKEGFIYINELESFVGNECYCGFSNEKDKNQRAFGILLLKDQTVLFHVGQQYNGYDALNIQSMRVPNAGDVDLLGERIVELEILLREKEGIKSEKERQRKSKEEQAELDDFLFSFLDNWKTAGLEREIERLKAKIFFATSAINKSSKITLPGYMEGHHLNSLYYSSDEIEQQKENALRDRLHMVWQRQAIADIRDKRSGLKKEVCPACLNERIVLENLVGLFNIHYAQRRVCHFCWGEEHNPLEDYLAMNEDQFKEHLEKMFDKKRVNFYIRKSSVSTRARLSIYKVCFHSQYNMMPAVSEVYNMIFAALAIREHGIMNPKMIADVLTDIQEPHNRITFITIIFPLFNYGFISLPKYNEEHYSLKELVDKYEESDKVLNVLNEIYLKLTQYVSTRHLYIDGLKEQFTSISADLIKGYEEVYQLAEILLNVLYYMINTQTEFEDYLDTDKLTVKEVIRFCVGYENSPFKNQKITENKVRNWIKKGELIGEKNGMYYIKKRDLLDFFNEQQKEQA